MHKQNKRTHKDLFIFLLAILFVIPIWVTVSHSFMSPSEINARYSIYVTAENIYNSLNQMHFVEMGFIPRQITLKQYQEMFFASPRYLGLFWNSCKIAAPVVIGQILISVPAAYSFEFGKFRYKEILFFIYIVIMLMPLQVVLVPHYIVADFLGIKESILAIILPGIVNPFGTFLIRQYMRSIPVDYIEAAKIDGCGQLQILIHIVLPNIKSAIAALSMLTFIEYWNVVEQAVLFIKDSTMEPFSVFLSGMADSAMDVYFAAACFYMLPTVLVFLFGHENLEKGIQHSGLK